MSGFKFCVNISYMFKEFGHIPKRYQAAKDAGFTAVECNSIFEGSNANSLDDATIEEMVKAKENSGLEHVNIVSTLGNWEAGERGYACVPGKEKQFKDSVEDIVRYAKALDCPRVHIVSGVRSAECTMDEMKKVYVQNMKYAAEKLQKEGLVLMIEPINEYILPGYFLSSVELTLEMIEKINHPNLTVELDLYHLQMIAGNLTNNIKRLLPYTEHVQIAQAPNCSNVDEAGEIDYRYILQVLKKLEYKKWIALEYFPTGATMDSFGWLKTWDL